MSVPITGIYKITNLINNKIYIGSSYHDIKMRFRRHKSDLNRNKHDNKHLQASWNKYGSDNFIFEIIEYCESSECIKREQYYIDSLKPQYNKCLIAGNCAGRKASKETKLKMSLKRLGNKFALGKKWNDEKRRKLSTAVRCINPVINEIKEFYSLKEAARQIGNKCNHVNISRAIKMKKIYHNLYWELSK